eukprot:2325275-Amphidinium_carterae.1
MGISKTPAAPRDRRAICNVTPIRKVHDYRESVQNNSNNVYLLQHQHCNHDIKSPGKDPDQNHVQAPRRVLQVRLPQDLKTWSNAGTACKKEGVDGNSQRVSLCASAPQKANTEVTNMQRMKSVLLPCTCEGGAPYLQPWTHSCNHATRTT